MRDFEVRVNVYHKRQFWFTPHRSFILTARTFLRLLSYVIEFVTWRNRNRWNNLYISHPHHRPNTRCLISWTLYKLCVTSNTNIRNYMHTRVQLTLYKRTEMMFLFRGICVCLRYWACHENNKIWNHSGVIILSCNLSKINYVYL